MTTPAREAAAAMERRAVLEAAALRLLRVAAEMWAAVRHRDSARVREEARQALDVLAGPGQ